MKNILFRFRQRRFCGCLLFLILSCMALHSEAQKSDYCELSGQVDTGFNGKCIHIWSIDYSGMNPQINDSALVGNGKFHFKKQLHTPGLLFSLYINGQGAFKQLLLENKSMTINLRSENWWNDSVVSIVNAPLNAQYRDWNKRTDHLSQTYYLLYKLDSLEQKHPDSAYTELKQTIDSMKLEKLNINKQYIKTHPRDYLSLYTLSYFLGGIEKTPDTLAYLFRSLSNQLKQLPEGQKLAKKIDAIYAIDKGKIAPDFQIPDTAGHLVSLKAFRGSYVLIDFWATWCGPCIESFPELKNFYARHKAKGLKLISVSFDTDKDRWRKGIVQYGLDWTNVSELKGWGSTLGADYNIQYIPRAILLDPDGRILENDVDLSKTYF